ncbi:MAG TPA: hypothetical protein VGB91_02880, partial [Rhizomicrobium sp.]
DLRHAFSAIMNEQIPDRLLLAVRQAPLGAPARLRDLAAGLGAILSWRMAAPVGAALALGLVLGVALDQPFVTRPLVGTAADGQILASGALATALDDRLVADEAQAGPIQIDLSFRSKAGQDCRVFTLSGKSATSSGIACRSDRGWAVASLANEARAGVPRTPYQMAGAQMSDTVRRAVDAMIAGEPFDGAAERAARQRGWREGPRR